ncbi:MAG TPA: ABC transporter permease [Gaiellaceae bacterium]|nr:ABC transporter permease [Gaiellaceae bacterium]
MLTAAVAAGTPLLFAALGETVAERAGVINLGIEGTMLVGAVVGFVAMDATGSLASGVAAALGAGALAAAVHAFFSVTLRANQIISGLGVTIAATGLSALIGRSVVGIPAEARFREVDVPGLAAIPGIGEIFFQHHVLVYAGYVLAPLVWWVLARTRVGLHLRACGESPAAADVMGVSVTAYRYGAVMFGGALAGLAGASLSLAEVGNWSENMTAGRGFIALALVIFATWDPLRVMVGAFFFGTLDVLAFRAQIIGVDVPATLLGMIPYVATILVLVAVTALGSRRRLRAPDALGEAYVRGG